MATDQIAGRQATSAIDPTITSQSNSTAQTPRKFEGRTSALICSRVNRSDARVQRVIFVLGQQRHGAIGEYLAPN